MSSASVDHTDRKSEELFGARWLKKIWVPYAIAMSAQLPMLVLYARELWSRPHYQFAPFAVLATCLIAYNRWPRDKQPKYYRSSWSACLFAMGIICCLAGYIFLTPWFSALSVMLLTSSLFARTIDSETGRGMAVASLPLYVALIIPSGGDYTLINWLQRISASVTSATLDIFGMNHHLSGTLIEIPGSRMYNIENACSGVQSFFTLLFVAVVFVIWERRPMFRSLVLIAAAVVWAIFMNSIRIIMIPVADYWWGLDLSTGFQHELLGYGTLTLGILLLLSTDQVLLFLFGPGNNPEQKKGRITRLLSSLWSSLTEPQTDNPSGRKRKTGRRSISMLGLYAIWSAAILMLLAGAFQFVDVVRSYSRPKYSVQFFSTDVTKPFSQDDLPETMSTMGPNGEDLNWTQIDYRPQNRSRGSDLGLRSDTWIYETPVRRLRSTISMDQTFPGWHELTTCYRNTGWTLTKRKLLYSSIEVDGETVQWPYIEAHFRKDTGEYGFLLFSLFDAFGDPMWAPRNWGTLNSFFIRAQNRLNHRIRGSLFQSETYQTQAFVSQYGEFSQQAMDEIRSHFLVVRELLREEFLSKRAGSQVVEAIPPTETQDASTP
ncbi:MAG: exosortase U [Mariniblastus sp.]|nr:exosortase U [Mariniblastus sp.]